MARMIGYRRFGGVEVLEEGSVSLPAPAEGQVLVSVRAAGINPVDYKLFGGLTRPLEVIRTIVHPSRWFARGKERPLRGVGQDFAGVVTAVGPSVNNVCVGDEVIGLLRAAPWSAREYGALATDVLTSVTNVVPKPASVSFDVAGGLGVAAQTAMGAMRSVKGEAGDVIVVAAAAGGVGGLVTQLALARGATVIGIASPSNADYLRSLGAIPVSYGESLEQQIRDVAPHPSQPLSTASVATRRWPTASASRESAWALSFQLPRSPCVARALPAGATERSPTLQQSRDSLTAAR